ncbi:restriction endonuclease subunit S [Algoriphagus sp.]|jgi:type I restriction enzyme S subunit|uniref:restriction endonuclease subunit S n=1 Tax=Algoriphagus sp. TaxID=1872435 RepID=UPI002723F69D|nr:restriction endonuclease subunit S [Algoriphagus sp.]MDO8966368.1 restriction endonuclease subunit S [Algoriphagus sp.]MDP3202315.1 restriction endonuclease subunit S [Algoriphagus sp.]
MSLIHKVSDLFKERKGSTSIHPSWKIIELKKACEIQNGFAFQSSEFNSLEGIPLIRIRDILKHNPETFFRGSFNDFYIVRKGDLLVGMDGDFNHSLWKGPDSLLNQRVCRIIPNQKILLKRFLYYGLGDYLKKINENTSSTTVKHLSSKSIGEIPFALPPLPEQQRIVAKLDAVFGHLDRLREKLDRIPELLKNFRQQVLTQAVTGELTREWRAGKDLADWEKTTIGDLFEVKTGGTPRRGVKEYYEGGTIPWVKSGLVKNELIFEADEFITELAIRDSNVKIFPIDTLLVAMYGEGKTRGQVGWLKIKATTNQAIAALVKEGMPNITRTYIYYYCLSQYNDIRAKAEGGNQPNLNLGKIKEWEISIPPMEEQIQIVSRIDSLFELSNKIESQYQSLKAKIDQLPQAVLAKAFRGELVGQEVKEYVREAGEVLMAAEARYKI